MPPFTLSDSVIAVDAHASPAARDRPHRSTRELEKVFARPRSAWRVAGLAIAVAASAGIWAALAAMMF